MICTKASMKANTSTFRAGSAVRITYRLI